ncbi:hypothetical protein [Lentzea sp. NBRC 105346]|uniref:hypothetical protein n=1 Tax=Lentzea sp. NBRC 105346 TaxID=3032205 RepID=UPI002554C3D8|nr:hypothetical protein [Lentzea sp. NBRC 105346]
MADDDFDHERTAQPCRVHARSTAPSDVKQPGSSWHVTCTTHDANARVNAGDEALARGKFVCDRGRRWQFLAQRPDDWCPRQLLSLTDLADEIRSLLLAEKDAESCNSRVWPLLVVHRYLAQHAECLPLDVYTRQLDTHKVLVAVRERDTPILLPLSDAGSTCDAYESDGVTYLLMTIDLATNNGVVIDPTPEPLDRQNHAPASTHAAAASEATRLSPVPA